MEPGSEPRQQGCSIHALNHSTPSWTFQFCDWNPFREDFLRVRMAQIRRLGCLEMGAWSPCSAASEALGAKLEPLKGERGILLCPHNSSLFSAYNRPFCAHQGAESWIEVPASPQEWGVRLRSCVSRALRCPRHCRQLLATPHVPKCCLLAVWAPSL